ASGALAHFDTLSAQTDRINNLFSATDTGLSATLQQFANALHDVANTPSSMAAREALLGQARTLAERLKSYDSQLAQFDRQAQASIESEVERISALAANIARLNDSIAINYGNTGRLPNDLLDQRDRLIDELATHL